jgi:hypothetical protein
LQGSGLPFVEVMNSKELDGVIASLSKSLTVNLPTVSTTSTNHATGSATFLVETIVIDQLTTFYNILMDDIIDNVSRKRDPEARDMPVQADYGQARRRMTRFLFELNKLPCHKLYLCLEEVDKDDKGNERGLPMIAGKLAREVGAYVDFMLRFCTRREQQGNRVREYRALQTSTDSLWEAKDSTGRLPAWIEVAGPKTDVWGIIRNAIQ